MTDGIPYLEFPQLTDAERTAFWARIDKAAAPDACWPWTDGRTGQGYGAVKIRRRQMVAHRLAYVLVNGQIPSAMQIDHACHNADPTCVAGVSCEHRRCCNPAHLEAVTAQDNTRRGRSLQAQNAVKTHCLNGHPLSGDNLYVPPKEDGRRYCKTCRRGRRHRRSEARSEVR